MLYMKRHRFNIARPGAPRRSSTITWRSALAAALGWVASSLPLQAQGAPQVDPPSVGRVTFTESIKEVLQGVPKSTSHNQPSATLVRSELTQDETQARLDFSVALKLRDAAGLQARVAKGETIPLEQ